MVNDCAAGAIRGELERKLITAAAHGLDVLCILIPPAMCPAKPPRSSFLLIPFPPRSTRPTRPIRAAAPATPRAPRTYNEESPALLFSLTGDASSGNAGSVSIGIVEGTIYGG